MRKLVLVVVAALCCAAPANAKEVLGAQLCGAGGCATQHAAGLLEGHGGPLGDGPLAAASKPGPWYHGYLLLGDRGKVFGRFAFYYVPDGRVVVQPGEGAQVTTWLHPSPRLAVLLADLASRLKPYPMPELTEVAVNGRPAADPESYLKLYAVGKKATTYPSEMGTQVSLQTDRRTPWSDGNDVVVYPKSNLLVRDGQILSIPGSIADRAARGESLEVGGSGRPWTWVAAIGGALAAALALAALLRRPRTASKPAVQT